MAKKIETQRVYKLVSSIQIGDLISYESIYPRVVTVKKITGQFSGDNQLEINGGMRLRKSGQVIDMNPTDQ